MAVPDILRRGLRIPVVAAPMFIVSHPPLTLAQCKAGVIGAFPALNARPESQLDEWLAMLTEQLAAHDAAHPARPAAPYAVNQIVHKTNARLDSDLALCVKHRVPIVIVSLGARREVCDAVHSYGGIVLQDVIHDRHARKAVAEGADGLIAVAAGAGGHGGSLSPFALVQEIRQWYDGPLLLAGAISTGRGILAVQAMGADMVYMGTPFIATAEARADTRHKEMIVASRATDIVYSNLFTGIHGSFLKGAVRDAGLDPDDLPGSNPSKLDFDPEKTKAWKDIWSAGQGVGGVDRILPVDALVDRLGEEYRVAKDELQQAMS